MNTDDNKLFVPESLQQQLGDYRRRVWLLKITEALAVALFSIGCAYAAVFVLDRLLDTPRAVRAVVFVAALAGCATLPWFLHRWVWRRRTPAQLSRLLARRLPRMGDQLLGVIELAENRSEQARSRTLVRAAIEQAAADATRSDFAAATPPSRRAMWAGLAGVFLLIAAGLVAVFPAAAQNAWARFLQPWGSTARYTFAAVEPLPSELVVAHGEPFNLRVNLAPTTEWRPESAEARIGRQRPVQAPQADDAYELLMPAQIGEDEMRIQVGDASHSVRVKPTVRPELTGLAARVRLPAYLGREEPVEKEIRGGAVSVVKGSTLGVTATASRPLESATVDAEPQAPRDASFDVPDALIEESQQRELAWVDELGLSGADPLRVSITALNDEPPSLIVENLPNQEVVLESDIINFTARVRDDYGVRRVGFEWSSLPFSRRPPEKGERYLAAGNSYAEALNAQGAFSARSLGITPQPLAVRVFAEDYFPERGRVYSAPHVLYVLTPDEHAIWITEQLSKWRRQALEVRDRELQLYEENRAIRGLAADDLDQADTRQRIEKQAAAERANGRRLRRLTAAGGELIREAARNAEIGVGHIDRWESMMKLLDEISANRMPSVADLLSESSDAPKVAQSQQPSAPNAGQNRDASGGKPGQSDPNSKPKPAVPTIADRESSFRGPDEPGGEGNPTKKKSSKAKLTFPVTTIAGSAKPKAGGDNPAGQKMEQAVTEQRDLLDEFSKIADELNEILANLEGSTLVKRLKAAARAQYQLAGDLGQSIPGSFGLIKQRIDKEVKEVLSGATARGDENVQAVSYIMDDMHAYFERRRMTRFKLVLDEMRELDILQGLRRVSGDIEKKQGLAIAQSEFWSDTLDRWADDLVDPACSGQCPGGASPESLPPSIVLEAMRILEAEIGLREETRVAEQSKPAVEELEHNREAVRLSESQRGLELRVGELSDRILELEEAERHFAKELRLLQNVSIVMDDAVDILSRPETGSEAIAAETEAIELLLRSKKLNPRGGGGGGSSPGGGGGGDTDTPALELAGEGKNDKEVREHHDVSQVTGESGQALPAEFRAGLDEYFSRLDSPGGA
ncbi:hypothetical protein Pla123a_19300 [Posidoniimonas polymericola]|uniref:Uncharacterized protein n=1 Tax=Posidoniimonas polymericola TaxID=2528002 RepID=A0A5C5YQY3_9BACT|nr:hypothetical protein [Posidoniimonas polymericola]TWT77273.1 hypothetical protein Pla123a_19300 [Posidoniimonas polymericola]